MLCSGCDTYRTFGREGHPDPLPRPGRGLGITYDRKPLLTPRIRSAMLEALDGLSCTLFFEPAAFIVGNAGVLLGKVLYPKRTAIKNFIITDAGMNDLVRPSFYGSYHKS